MMNYLLRYGLVSMLAGSVTAAGAWGQTAGDGTYDVVVYGGTAGGVAAAVQAARMGKKVALLSPSQHLGGMSSGGLSYTDTYWTDSIGGIAADFYRRAGREGYNQASSEYHFEPHVAERIFDEMVREASIDVIRGDDLDLSAGGVVKTGSRIDAIRTEGGKMLSGQVFIDASYEGDLMAKAGVTYTVGRESNATYGEKYNGMQKQYAFSHQFNTRVDPFVVKGDPASGLLPGISAAAPGADGTGDNRVQAYNFRLTLTKDPANKRPWTAPANYDAGQYELLRRYIQAAGITQVKGQLLKIDAIRGGKYDLNNQGAFSTDFIGANYDYPDADHATRQQIVAAQKQYQQGLLYFLATDPGLPQSIRDEMNSYGLTKDEFTDNDGWSNQLYVREARRMVGPYVMTDSNVVSKNGLPRVAVADPVGLGSYTMDSHNTERYVAYDPAKGEYYVKNEGDVQVGIPGPYGIAYNALTPRQVEASNLIVPGAISASHIAYGSMRMEPVFMILGQSAGTAAVQAIEGNTSVQQVNYGALAGRLRDDGQVLSYGTATAASPRQGTLREDFNYGPDANRIDVVSYTHGGWSEAWGGARDYLSQSLVLDNAPSYSTAEQLHYDAAGYVNSAPVGQLVSGGAGTSQGPTYSADVSGRGINGGLRGTVWISALARIDSLAADQDALLWLDRDSTGNVENAGDAFIGLRKGGIIQLRYGGSNNLFEASNAVYAAGTTHLLLARIDMDEQGTGDTISFWIDPDLMDLGAANLVASAGDWFGSSFDGIGLSIGAGGGAIDAIRISNLPDGFFQVTRVPEPGGMGLLGLGAAALLRRQRRNA